MNRRFHEKLFNGSIAKKAGLKTEDKIILGIAFFVGASAISLVTFGGAFWNTVSSSVQSQLDDRQSFDQFDRFHDDFSESFKNAATQIEENHKMISEFHAAHTKHLGSSMDNMQDAFDEYMKKIEIQMDKNWEVIRSDALKRITAPLTLFEEAERLRKGN